MKGDSKNSFETRCSRPIKPTPMKLMMMTLIIMTFYFTKNAPKAVAADGMLLLIGQSIRSCSPMLLKQQAKMQLLSQIISVHSIGLCASLRNDCVLSSCLLHWLSNRLSLTGLYLVLWQLLEHEPLLQLVKLVSYSQSEYRSGDCPWLAIYKIKVRGELA